MRSILWAALLSFFVGGLAHAEPASPPPAAAGEDAAKSEARDLTIFSNELRESAFAFEYGVPATPALTIIGASGDTIPTSANLQRFSLSLLRASEEAGGGAAAGLDFSPYWGLDKTMSLQSYRQGSFRRDLLRARVSAAFAEGDEAKKASSRASIGFATSLLDSSDPSMITVSRSEVTTRAQTTDSTVSFYSACTIQSFAEQPELKQRYDAWEEDSSLVGELETGDSTPEERAAAKLALEASAPLFRSSYAKVAEDCRTRTLAHARQGRAWDIGAALQWRGEAGSLDGLEPAGTTAWSTITTGRNGTKVALGKTGDTIEDSANWRGVAHLRLDFDTSEVDDSGVRFEFDRRTLALAAERLAAESVYSVQVSYSDANGPRDSEFDGAYWQYVLHADFKTGAFLGDTLGKDTWISISLGAIDGDRIESDTYASVALKFKAPSMTPIIPSPWR